jgi:hypothetical protein
MIAAWFRPRRSITVPCTVELEQTHEFLQAHVTLEGIEVDVADEVQVHDAPTEIAFGDRQVFQRRATVTRASALDKFVTRLLAYRELTELYEVGFDAESFKFSAASATRGR